MALRVAIFDDVLWARKEEFRIPGLEVTLHEHADEAAAFVPALAPAVVCMDGAMGAEHATGPDAVRALRAAGYKGRIVAMSSDPAVNAEMVTAGADEALERKALLRPFLMALGRGEAGAAAPPLLLALAAAAAVLGMALVGPFGFRSRYQGDAARLSGVVRAGAEMPSAIDGSPVVAEELSVEMSDKKTLAIVARTVRAAAPTLSLDPRDGGRSSTIRLRDDTHFMGVETRKRIRGPDDVPEAAMPPPVRGARYAAVSRRIRAGQAITVVGRRQDGGVVAEIVADEDGSRHLPDPLVPRGGVQAGGLALLAAAGCAFAGAALLALRR